MERMSHHSVINAKINFFDNNNSLPEKVMINPATWHDIIDGIDYHCYTYDRKTNETIIEGMLVSTSKLIPPHHLVMIRERPEQHPGLFGRKTLDKPMIGYYGVKGEEVKP